MASPLAHGSTQDTHFTPELQTRFLDYLADAHSVKTAAKLCGINRDTAYDLRSRNPSFALAWDDAVKARGDFWEDQLRRLADRPKPDTLGVIIGLKMTGRFVEERRGQVVVSVNLNQQTLSSYSVDDLEAMLLALKQGQAIEGEVRELPMLEPASDDKDANASPSDAGEASP